MLFVTMTSSTMDSSVVYTSWIDTPAQSATSDVPLIVGLTIGIFVLLGVLVCLYYHCKYKPERLKKRSARGRKPSIDGSTIPISFISIETPVLDRKKDPEPAHPHPPLPSHPHPHIHKPSKAISSDPCVQDICKQYLIDLRLNRAYFNPQYDECYCSQCYSSTKTDRFTRAGSVYTAPRGWARFGLQIDRAFASPKEIFKTWYTTFYGTSNDKLEVILRERFIPFPGDALLSDKIFTTHLPDKDHIYTSPSIYYASLRHVSPTHTKRIRGRWYDVQVVLECKQNPGGIIKQRGYRSNVCRIIPENEIEWKTNQRSSVVPYGLFIRAQEHQCTNKCAVKHSS